MYGTEFTTMAGRRLREAVKKTLISSGNGEFDDQTHVVIAGLTNAYSQYIATFEEYEQQRYEVGPMYNLFTTRVIYLFIMKYDIHLLKVLTIIYNDIIYRAQFFTLSVHMT